VFLSRVRHDGVVASCTDACRTWASFTLAILPGHDDRRSEKTRRLIEKALARSPVDQPCEFDWSAFSYLRQVPQRSQVRSPDQSKSGGRLASYIRPKHLNDLATVHVRLTFEHPVPGP
jgi:CRISPR-associated protein Csb2